MEAIRELEELNINRELVYRLLARMMKIEADSELLKQLGQLKFPEDGVEADMAEGYLLLQSFLQQQDEAVIDNLAVDFARIFLGAGTVGFDAAYPYESVYTSEKHLVMQDARDEIVAVYRARGVDKDSELDIPEDHIALEFEFMAELCRNTVQACQKNEVEIADKCMQEQKEFLDKHLFRWVPEFCRDITKYAATDFYRAAAKLVSGYMKLETAIFDDVQNVRAVGE